MSNGFYAIFEGGDGSGKTTTMANVAKRLNELNIVPKLTNHPGSTPLGKHIRQLVKFPESFNPDIKIDELSLQTLYMVDTISFIRTVLEPSLKNNEVIFADRSSFISAIIYGVVEGLELKDVERLFNLITAPKADRLYILTCPWEISRERVMAQRGVTGSDGTGKLDRFDRKPDEFFLKVSDLYENLITKSPEMTALISRAVSLDDVIFIDSSLPQQTVENIIINDMLKVMRERDVLPSVE